MPLPPRPVGNLCAAAALRVARVCDTVSVSVANGVETTRVVCGFTADEEVTTRESTSQREERTTSTPPCRHVLGVLDADMRGLVESAHAALSRVEDAHVAPFVANEFEWAAAHGGVVTLAGLLSEGGVPADVDSGRVLFCAGWSGDAHTAAAALANFAVSAGDTALCTGAALAGRLPLLQWAQQRGCGCDGWTMVQAAAGGDLRVLKHLLSGNCPWSEDAAAYAGHFGRLTVLQWAHDAGLPLGGGLCPAAAQAGQLEVVRWAREVAQCPWGGVFQGVSLGTCEMAAFGGHLDLLKWCRASGAPWGEGVAEAAAERGHLEVLRWAVEDGCPWSAKQCAEFAEEAGHAEVASWAREHDGE